MAVTMQTPASPGLPSASATRGIMLMLGTVLLFSIMDVCAKELGNRVGVATTLWARYAGQTTIVLLLVLPRLGPTLRTRYPGLQLLRSMCLFAATFCFFSGLRHLALAENTAVMNINPVLITLGGALFLGERLGLRRALGIGAALIGALIVIQPGTSVFTPAAVFPLCAAVGFSAYTLLTRFVGRDEDAWTSLLYTAAFGAVVMTALLPFFGQMPQQPSSFALIGAIGIVSAIGQMMLIKALQTTEAGVLAPFAYVGLLFSVIWGQVIFGEVPDTATLLGATVIVGAGLYVWFRETRLARRRPAAPPR